MVTPFNRHKCDRVCHIALCLGTEVRDKKKSKQLVLSLLTLMKKRRPHSTRRMGRVRIEARPIRNGANTHTPTEDSGLRSASLGPRLQQKSQPQVMDRQSKRMKQSFTLLGGNADADA